MTDFDTQYDQLARRAAERRWVRCVCAPGGVANRLVRKFADDEGAYLTKSQGNSILATIGAEIGCAPRAEAISARLREQGIPALCVLDATPADEPELLELAASVHVVAVVLGTVEAQTYDVRHDAPDYKPLGGVDALIVRARELQSLYRPGQILGRWAADRRFLDAHGAFDRSLQVAAAALPRGAVAALQRFAMLPVAVPVEIGEVACRGTGCSIAELVDAGWVAQHSGGLELRQPYQAQFDVGDPQFLEEVGDAMSALARAFTDALRSPRAHPGTFATFFAADALGRWIAERSPRHRGALIDAFAALSELRTVDLPAATFLEQIDDTSTSVARRLAAARRLLRDGEDVALLLADANALAFDEPGLAARCQTVIAVDVARRDADLATRKLRAAQSRLEEGSRDWALLELRLGHMALQRQELADAHQYFLRSLRAQRRTLPPVWHIDALSGLAYTHARRDELLVSREHYEQALQILEDAGDAQRAPLMAFNLGTVLLALQDTAARTMVEQALRAWRERGEEQYFATAHLQLGLSALVFGQPDADRALADAVRWGQWTGDDNSVLLATGLLALSTRPDRSEASFVAAVREVVDALSVEHFPVETTMFRRLINAEPVALTTSDDERFVRAALRALDEPSHPSAHPWVVLFRRHATALPRAAVKAHVLTIGPGCEVFRIDDGERVDISRREPLKRILKGLVAAHQKSQRYGFSVDDLIGVGWPGEVLDRKAGANRVYTAIRFLRAAGLQDCLVKSHEGYRIASQYAVVSDVKL